jgi:NADPH-dependent ferric siderophore reductase
MSESRLPMRVFRSEVRRVEDLSPGMRRIVLGVEADYLSTGVGDEYLRIVFPPAGTLEPSLPAVVDGQLDYGSVDMGLLRTYTVRDFDPAAGELTIDFVVHDGGVAASWARAATPADVVAVNTPTAMYSPPSDLIWQILVADCAALPAACRILETTPADVRTRVVVEIADDSHRIELPNHPSADVTWVHGGNGTGPSGLEQVLRSLPRPDGVGYIWVAGETRALRGVRRFLRHELGLPSSAYKAVGYWIDHAEEWRRRYDALDPATLASLEALWDTDRDEDEIEAEYDARLTELGL